ncbi:MAG: hypothetical protein WDA65_02095 [Christensenellales bacterium]
MAINPVQPTPQSGFVNMDKAKNAERSKAAEKTSNADTPAAVYEKSSSVGEKNKLYTKDSALVSKIGYKADAKFAGLKSVVEKLLTMQSVKTGEGKGLSYAQIFKKYNGNIKGFFENFQADEATRLKAQQDISEDGYWGVKQTSGRIIEFAISISGGDTAKLAELKGAIEKGFAAAEKAWGGALPEICRQTREAVFKGLDEWTLAE